MVGPSTPEGSTVGPKVLSHNLAQIYLIFSIALMYPYSKPNPTSSAMCSPIGARLATHQTITLENFTTTFSLPLNMIVQVLTT